MNISVIYERGWIFGNFYDRNRHVNFFVSDFHRQNNKNGWPIQYGTERMKCVSDLFTKNKTITIKYCQKKV